MNSDTEADRDRELDDFSRAMLAEGADDWYDPENPWNYVTPPLKARLIEMIK
jgi:hypothetical protein